MAYNHHTKDKGDLAVLKVAADCSEKGWTVLFPATEHAPFDLVIYKDQKFKRLQVKFRTLTKGYIDVNFKSIWSDKHGIHTIMNDKSQFDLYAIYCPETKLCYYLDPINFNVFARLRVNEPRSKQKYVNRAENYLLIN